MLVGTGGTATAELLAGLTPLQRRAVETMSSTVCVLASAGSGKTRVLTRRIAYRALTGSAKPEHTLALTFTKKAAGELAERLAGLGLAEGVNAGTFHSLAWHQLRRWWADRRTPQPALLQSKARLVGELASGRGGLEGVATSDLAAAVEWAKARLVPPGELAASAHEANRELPAEAEAVAALYARYEDEKRRRRLVDFEDLLARYADALSSDSRFAAAQRWRWAHVFVDEVQDVNPLQCRVLLGLLAGNDDLFVVGDPNQAIYGWNGADARFLTEFPLRFPDAEVVRLDDNHRSSPQVVAAATAVLGRQSAGPVRSSRPDGPLPTLRCFANELAEAAGIAAEIREAASQGLGWADMAVLARTNAQLVTVMEALVKAGVPCRTPAPAEDAAPDAPDGRPQGAGRANVEGEPHEDDPGLGWGNLGWANTVTLCSFHRAKGLQWQAVWVCGLETGFVPIAYASSPGSLAEERRLLYVALTRAERRLHCSWSNERRAASGAVLRRNPSPWLAVLAPHCSGTRAGDDVASPAEAISLAPSGRDRSFAGFLAMARGRLAPAPGASSPEASSPEASAAVADELRQWRGRLARASGVPPHVLLHDSTLLALARSKPKSTEELLAVPGLGPVKVARFGPQILAVVSEAMAGDGREPRGREPSLLARSGAQ
jgi:DNA helicase-2/ATP-dependent DNA helicase PcrA